MTSADYNAYRFLLPSHILCGQRAVLGFLGKIYCFLFHHITLINPVSNNACMGRQRQGCAASKLRNHTRKDTSISVFQLALYSGICTSWRWGWFLGQGVLQLGRTAWLRCLPGISRCGKIQLQDLQCRTCEILFFVGLYCDKSKQKRLIKTSKLVLPILDVL